MWLRFFEGERRQEERGRTENVTVFYFSFLMVSFLLLIKFV